VSLNAAPREVLMTVPGLGDEIVQRLLDRRRSGAYLSDHRDLLSDVSQEAARALLDRWVDMVQATQVDPTRWTILVSAVTGEPAIASTKAITIARGTGRVAVSSRQSR
jgi:hypothetical protein